MSHDAHAGHGHDDHHPPEKQPKKPVHGPSDCYGMPQKKFWRIVLTVGFLTAGLVVAGVLLGSRAGVL